jgi:hypothetical protein
VTVLRSAPVLAACAVVAALAAAPTGARASLKISAATSSERLEVDAAGRAEIDWHVGARTWSAVVEGDRITYGRTLPDSATARRVSPTVVDALVEEVLPDGEHFALQKLQRTGQFGARGPFELRFARWHGAPPVLTLRGEWAESATFPRLCGTATYHGKPFFGLRHTISGNPLDDFGRNVYLDVKRPGGWYRIMGVLTHPDGYALLLRTGRWLGPTFRALVVGPNVDGDLAPDVVATAPMPQRGTADVCPFPQAKYAGG